MKIKIDFFGDKSIADSATIIEGDKEIKLGNLRALHHELGTRNEEPWLRPEGDTWSLHLRKIPEHQIEFL